MTPPRWLRASRGNRGAPVTLAIVDEAPLNPHDVIVTRDAGRMRHYCITCGAHTLGGFAPPLPCPGRPA